MAVALDEGIGVAVLPRVGSKAEEALEVHRAGEVADGEDGDYNGEGGHAGRIARGRAFARLPHIWR
jgi:hypothetical protein